jgi:outer membrane lipoprotein SlyB
MSNAKTGLWSALGAIGGALLGAQAGKYAAKTRPRYSYAEQPHGPEVEDAMVVGAAAGAVLGAFVAGAAAGEPAPPPAPQPPQLTR